MSEKPIGVLVMAYGTAAGPTTSSATTPTSVAGGARLPSTSRSSRTVRAIGNVFPLLDTTRAQAEEWSNG
jgi:hypothetical protein